IVIRTAPQDPAIELSTAQAGTLLTVGIAQALLLSLRRLRPVLCVAAVMACQTVMIAAVPDVSANGLNQAVAVYTLGSVATFGFTAAAVAVSVLVLTAAGAVASLGRDDMLTVTAGHLGSNALLLV